MFKRICAILFLISFNSVADEEKGLQGIYYEEPVEIYGTIDREVAGFPSIRPVNIISATSNSGNVDGLEPPEFGIGIMQLVISKSDMWDKFEKAKGKKGFVTCKAYHADNAHHMTPVLCEVGNIIVK
ncbi:TPA: DUF4431 domain-containing protein [Providencia alcalifaciens]|uniref:DUF4431 domain-containing protein n=1 Tax=Providencia alcalifaciens TaxID=126385 RepID=UPI001CC51143|nr:DUF4431 domain-containing protein [Providencia alcalifaciens]CAG9418743.1 hypothetical protein NVI2019_NGLDDFDA_01665 [Providencia alcalifaciens]